MNILSYIRETQNEMKNVVWPKNKQVAIFTVLVIIISIGSAYFLGLFDIVFAKLLTTIIA